MTANTKGARGLAVDQPHPQHATKLDALLLALSEGNYISDAAGYADLGERTVRRYISEGKDLEARIAEHGGDENTANLTKAEQRKWQVWQAIRKARANARVEAVGIIRTAARGGTWQAAAWYLERSAPAQWGRWERRDNEIPETTMTPEQARDYLRQLPDTPLADLADE